MKLLIFLVYIFFREKLRRANVQFLSAPIKDATTGTVIVLTTPDAQRTMLAYQVQYATNEAYYDIYICATSLLQFEDPVT